MKNTSRFPTYHIRISLHNNSYSSSLHNTRRSMVNGTFIWCKNSRQVLRKMSPFSRWFLVAAVCRSPQGRGGRRGWRGCHISINTSPEETPRYRIVWPAPPPPPHHFINTDPDCHTQSHMATAAHGEQLEYIHKDSESSWTCCAWKVLDNPVIFLLYSIQLNLLNTLA